MPEVTCHIDLYKFYKHDKSKDKKFLGLVKKDLKRSDKTNKDWDP